MNVIEVSAGLVFRSGRLLITQRQAGAHLGGLWEFPGGKREPGETFEECLVRELREELAIEVAVGGLIETIQHDYPEKRVLLKFFRCDWRAHEPQALGCPAFAWVTREELGKYEFPAADARLLQRLYDGNDLWYIGFMSPLDKLVSRIRKVEGLSKKQVPDFCQTYRSERARFLLLLEAPGPKACAGNCVVSLLNEDGTARNLHDQLKQAKVPLGEIIIWNVVPWYLGKDDQTKTRAAKSSDIEPNLKYLGELLGILGDLEFIVLVGGAARKAHIFLSQTTDVRILSCYHTSNRVMNANRQAFKDNVVIFKRMLARSR